MPFKRKIVTREAPKRSTRKVTNSRRKVVQEPATRPGRAQGGAR